MIARSFVAVALALASLLATRAPAAQTPHDCAITSIGIDTSYAEFDMDGVLRRGIGQTFVARDTLIRSITAWRIYGQDTVAHPVKLWITRVGPDGYPDVYPGPGVLLEAPAQVFTGDGVHHVPLRFEFDPPFALPAAGQYAFFYQVCTYTINLKTTQPLGPDTLPDRYPEGQLWLTSRNNLGCYLEPAFFDPRYFAVNDLIFTIEFCHDTVTTVRRSSWGRLKSMYRQPSPTSPPSPNKEAPP